VPYSVRLTRRDGTAAADTSLNHVVRSIVLLLSPHVRRVVVANPRQVRQNYGLILLSLVLQVCCAW
jgi:hypothetical protein